ncbi:MAG: hypothetical protein ABEK01_03280 [Candidatus Nanohaloarchaea archaeon]
MKFEKRKLFLPLLFSLFVVLSAVAVENYRASSYGERSASLRGKKGFLDVLRETEKKIFGETAVNGSEALRTEYRQLVDEKSSDTVQKYGSKAVKLYYDLPFFFLRPSSPQTLDPDYASLSEGIVFSPEHGYFFSRQHYIETMKWDYREDRLVKFYKKVKGADNWSLSEYSARAMEIARMEVGERERLQRIRNLEKDWRKFRKEVGRDSAIERIKEVLGDLERLRQLERNDRIVNVRWYHFIPSLIATFGIFYLLNGLIILLNRWIARGLVQRIG